MIYKSGDAATLAGLSQVRLNQLFQRSAASGGIPLGNLHSPSGAQRLYDHIEISILSLAASVADGPSEIAGPPMRDLIVQLDQLSDVIEDLFVPEVSESWSVEELASAELTAKKHADRALREERAKFWTDRGADQWVAIVVARYTVQAGAELEGQLGILPKLHGSLLKLGAEMAGIERKLRDDPYAALHHVFLFNLHTVVDEVARRAEQHGIAFPARREKY